MPPHWQGARQPRLGLARPGSGAPGCPRAGGRKVGGGSGGGSAAARECAAGVRFRGGLWAVVRPGRAGALGRPPARLTRDACPVMACVCVRGRDGGVVTVARPGARLGSRPRRSFRVWEEPEWETRNGPSESPRNGPAWGSRPRRRQPGGASIRVGADSDPACVRTRIRLFRQRTRIRLADSDPAFQAADSDPACGLGSGLRTRIRLFKPQVPVWRASGIARQTRGGAAGARLCAGAGGPGRYGRSPGRRAARAARGRRAGGAGGGGRASRRACGRDGRALQVRACASAAGRRVGGGRASRRACGGPADGGRWRAGAGGAGPREGGPGAGAGASPESRARSRAAAQCTPGAPCAHAACAAHAPVGVARLGRSAAAKAAHRERGAGPRRGTQRDSDGCREARVAARIRVAQQTPPQRLAGGAAAATRTPPLLGGQ